jgi:prepilin-type N-terminal cleavage/methylation domain-containing protein
MREILRKLQKNHRKGYTLAELLIVIVITGILASFGFVEVAKAQRKLKRTELDNTAKEIFVAAQNHLTSAQTNGIWETEYFKDSAVNISATDYQQPLKTSDTVSTYYFEDYPYGTTDKEKQTEQNSSDHDYYYVVYSKTTYKNSLTDANSVLQQLLPFGSIDDTVRQEGSYVIEFDAKTESIYGVFYTDKGQITPSDLLNLNAYREDATAREKITITDTADTAQTVSTSVGYYGGAYAIKNKVDNLTSPVVQIFNDGVDTDGKAPSGVTVNTKALEAVITVPNDSIQASQKTLTVKLSQKSGVSAGTLPSGSFDVTYSNNSITLSNLKNVESDRIKNVISVVTTANGLEYHITLDDISDDNKQFHHILPKFNPGADIELDAVVSYAGMTPVQDGKIANSLFDSVSKDVDASNTTVTTKTGYYSVDIRTARHLQNLKESFSGYASVSNNVTLNLLSANVTGDIDWKASYSDKFKSIYNSTLKYFYGNNHVLSTFNVSGYVAQGATGGVGGLFAITSVSDFTVKDINLQDFNVSSSLQAGSLIGLINQKTTIENVHVYNSSDAAYGTDNDSGQYGVHSDSRSAGGLVGKIDGSTVTINYSSASESVNTSTDKTSAGGLIGLITSSTKTKPTVVISNCYVGGKVSSKTSYGTLSENTANIAGYYAGGFIGTHDLGTLSIDHSYTTSSTYGLNCSGGFVGYVNAGTMSADTVYAANAVAGKDNSSVGLFAGYETSNKLITIAKTSPSYVLSDVSSTTQTIGNSKSINNTKYLVSTTLSNLKAQTGTTTASAVPYLDSLEDTYPYPHATDANGNPIVHHGDWITEALSKTTITKYITIKNAADNDAELEFIKNNTNFDVYVDRTNPINNWTAAWWNYIDSINTADYYNTYSLSNADCTGSNGSYACSLDIDNLEPGSYYYVKEKDSGAEYNNLTNRYKDVSESGVENYFDSYWHATQAVPYSSGIFSYYWTYTYPSQYYSNAWQYGYTSYGLPIYNSYTQTTYSFSNTYQPKLSKSGLLYYEKYSDGTYKLHGYSDDGTEIGDDQFSKTENSTIVDDGYVLAVNDSLFENGNSGEQQVNAVLAYYDNEYWYGIGNTLSKLTNTDNTGQLIKVSTEDTANMGLSGTQVYKLNLSKENLQYIRKDGEAYIKVTNGNSIGNSPVIGNYTMNVVFADSVKAVNSYLGDGDPVHKLRTNAQLDRLISLQGYNIMNNDITNSGVQINQERDIDMSSYYQTNLANGNNKYFIPNMYAYVTYQGTTVTLSDGTTRNALLSGIENTFIQTIYGDDSTVNIQNLNVSLNIGNLSSSQISNAASGTYYGMFIDQLQGKMANVAFVDSTVNNLNIANFTASNTGSNVGIIGAADNGNSKLSNISFSNINFTDTTINTSGEAANFGLIGKVSCPVYNFNVDGVKWSGGSISSGNVGVIGEVFYGSDVNTFTVNNVDYESASITATNFGILPYLEAPVTNVTITNTTWNKCTIKSTYAGLIGYIKNGYDLSTITMKGTKWTSDNITGTALGLIGGTVINEDESYWTNVSMRDTTWTDLSGTETYCGLIGYAFDKVKIGSTSTNGLTIDTVNWSKVNMTSDHFGLIGKYNGEFTNISISNVNWLEVTVKNASDVYKSAYGANSSVVSFIPEVSSSNTALTGTQINVSKVAVENLTTKATVTGIVGDVTGTLSSMNVSDVRFYNDTTDTTKTKGVITGQSFGLIGNVSSAGNISGLTVKKGTTDYGLKLDGLVLNTRYWGVIAYNEGTISGTSNKPNVFDDISITGIDSSAEPSTTADAVTRSYGVVGLNAGKLTYFEMSDIRLGGATDAEKILLPNNEVDQFNRIHFGVIGYNKGTTSNEIGNGSASDVKIENIYKKDAKVQTTEYGFIGVNYGAGGTASVHDLSIANYSSKGNGIVWMNMANSSGDKTVSKISTITINNSSAYKIVGNAFALSNSATMNNCNITDASNTTKSIPGSGTVSKCKLNGNIVSAG